MSHSLYLNSAFNKEVLRACIEMAFCTLEPRSNEFDAIAFRGFSGCAVGPTLAFLLKKDMIYVRKTQIEEPCHGMAVEAAKCERYIIVDDFRSTGTTIRTIVQKLANIKGVGKAVGVYFWDKDHNIYTEKVDDIPVWSHVKT